MDQDKALNELGTALIDLLESQLEKGGQAMKVAMAEVLVVPGGRVRIEIEMPSLSVVFTIQPGEHAEVKELFRIEGGPGRAFPPRVN
jgi:hypothetical protein